MSDWIKNIVDADYLKENLTFSSLYIAVYESMTDYVESNIHDLLCDFEICNSELKYIETQQYKDEIKNKIVDEKGNKDKLKASFLWLLEQSAISKDEYSLFLNLKDVRNKYAHELINIICDGVNENEIILFGKMMELYKKISNWWFVNIESSFIGDELPEDLDTAYAQSGVNIMLDIVLDVLYKNKSAKYKELLHN